MDDCEIMKAIDINYRELTGFNSSRDYKIFNSHIHPFPLLIIGWNPGGKGDGTDLCASKTYFEAWEHDYVCFRNNSQYTIAAKMCKLLSQCLHTKSIDTLRQVPVTNLIFKRSPESKYLKESLVEIENSKSGLERIIRLVNPDIILLLGIKTYDHFVKYYCTDLQEEPQAVVYSKNGRERIYVRSACTVIPVNQKCTLLSIAHPTGYRWSTDLWQKTILDLQKDFNRLGISPIEATGKLVEVPPIPQYGKLL